MNQKARTAWTLQTLEIFIDHKAVNIKAPRILCVYASSMSEDLDFLLLCSMDASRHAGFLRIFLTTKL